MFVLKKIVSHIFFPVPLCLEILIVGVLLLLFTRKQRAGKVVVSVGVALFAAMSYTAVPTVLLRPLEYRYPPFCAEGRMDAPSRHKMPAVKWIVVLGGGHTSDPKIPATSRISNASLVRLIEAIRLHKRMPGSRLVLMGGKVFDDLPEAEGMAAVAMAVGVKRKDIVVEPCSKDTAEQASVVKQFVGNDGFILVTSASHMPRSMAMFKRMGMDPVPAPAGYMVKESRRVNPNSFFPGADGLSTSERTFYEYLGILWAKLRGQI